MSLAMHAAEAEAPASAVGAGASEWFALSGAPAFQRVLQLRPIFKTAHFAVHCLCPAELSTGLVPAKTEAVDDRPPRYVRARPPGGRLGLVVPKRQARRAVTRNLVKRQVRAAWDGWWRAAGHQDARFLQADWVVRLRAPIDRKQFVSGRSELLAAELRAELQGLFQAAARRVLGAARAGGAA